MTIDEIADAIIQAMNARKARERQCPSTLPLKTAAEWKSEHKRNNLECQCQQPKGYRWFEQKAVRVYTMPGVDQKVVPPVIAGVKDLIETVGLDFTVSVADDPAINLQVEKAITPDGKLQGDELVRMLVLDAWQRNELDHARVVITDFLFKENPGLPLESEENPINWWGQSLFSQGSIVLALSPVSSEGNRQADLGFLENLVKHEATHLFGLGLHHDHPFSRADYPEFAGCNFLYKAPTLTTCDKCRDALVAFWQGMEERTGKQFFRK